MTLPPKKGKAKAFNCPVCGGNIQIKAVGTSIQVICEYCSSTIDVNNENFHIIETAHEKIRGTPLSLGTRGKFFDVEWEIIGYMQRTNEEGLYPWDEYLLYNPYYGFRFLVQANNHWGFVKMLRQNITLPKNNADISLLDRKFKLFSNEKATVAYVKGEFYWRVKVGETVDALEYIAPPYLLSIEKNNQEITASLSFYLTGDEVQDAFKLKTSLPKAIGISPNQPSPFSEKKYKQYLMISFIALVLATIFQYLAVTNTTQAMLVHQRLNITPGNKNTALVSDDILLEKTGNLLIKSQANVDNNWAELDLSLVDIVKNEEVDGALQTIEYYHGRDNDGSWSEGSAHAETLFSPLKKGAYRLLIEPDSDRFTQNNDLNFEFSIFHDVPVWSNYLLTVMLLLLYPFYFWGRKKYFEILRWRNSDYSPYSSNAED